MQYLQRLIEEEKGVWAKRLQALNAGAVASSCPTRIPWASVTIQTQIKLAQLESKIYRRYKELARLWRRKPQELSVLGAVRRERVRVLLNYHNQERAYWQTILTNMIADLDKDITEYRAELGRV